MDDLLLQIGKRILDRRKQLQLTQEELAEQANITPQTISSAELGKKALRPENIIKICTALNISTDYLLRGIVTPDDYSRLTQQFSQLSSAQYQHLENIIDNFIAAVREQEA